MKTKTFRVNNIGIDSYLTLLISITVSIYAQSAYPLPKECMGFDVGGTKNPLAAQTDGVGFVSVSSIKNEPDFQYRNLIHLRGVFSKESGINKNTPLSVYEDALKQKEHIYESIKKIGMSVYLNLPYKKDHRAFASCKEIHSAFPNYGSGMYTVDPDGAGGLDSFSVYCEMKRDGGGWLLLEDSKISVPRITLEQFLAYVRSVWKKNKTEFSWEVRDTSENLVSRVKVRFDNSFEHWKNNHTGRLPDLNAYWSVEVPKYDIRWNDWHLTGIVRAEQYRVSSKEYPNSTDEGLHYKRTDRGEHFPWTYPDGTISINGSTYLCQDKNICGYEIKEDENPDDNLPAAYSIVRGKHHSIMVR